MKILNPLKKLGAGLFATGVTLTMAACYGPMDDLKNYSPTGRVTNSETGDPIPGIEVCARQHEFEGCGLTDSEGYFNLYETVPENIKFEDYEVCATDVDGTENGEYDTECQNVSAYTEDPNLEFSLTPTPQEK